MRDADAASAPPAAAAAVRRAPHAERRRLRRDTRAAVTVTRPRHAYAASSMLARYPARFDAPPPRRVRAARPRNSRRSRCRSPKRRSCLMPRCRCRRARLKTRLSSTRRRIHADAARRYSCRVTPAYVSAFDIYRSKDAKAAHARPQRRTAFHAAYATFRSANALYRRRCRCRLPSRRLITFAAPRRRHATNHAPSSPCGRPRARARVAY
jgi:hypothetical protein